MYSCPITIVTPNVPTTQAPISASAIAPGIPPTTTTPDRIMNNSDRRSTVGIDTDGLLHVDRVSLAGTWQGSGQRRILGINEPPVTMKSIECAIVDRGFDEAEGVLDETLSYSFGAGHDMAAMDGMMTAEQMDAIAEVYASIFGPDPTEYRAERGLLDVHEEMGIMIQEVVGQSVGKYFLPACSGVAFSNNEFRWSARIKREDGLLRLVPGLGTRAVDRVADDYPVLIAPGQPSLRVNVTADEVLKQPGAHLHWYGKEPKPRRKIRSRTMPTMRIIGM